MADIQATGELIKWSINGITVILMITAASMAIKKKNNIGFAVALLGNMIVYFVTRSPLLCWIVSIACIIWAAKSKGSQKEPDLKSSKSSVGKEKKSKVGNVIGLILGIGFVAGPLIGYLRQEASLKDPTTQGVLILFAVIGGFMIINNLFKLFEGGETVSSPAPAAVKAVQTSSKAKVEEPEEEPKENKVRCRFCKKLYSAEYNGCPYCKKK